MAYKVKLDIFEGPFDLLVYLIENAEMSIYDIKVAEITKQYVEYIEHIQKTDVVIAGEFMVLAASLIEIKSKMLLPRIKLDGEEEFAEDPRSELVEKLLEYKKYKKAATLLEAQEDYARQIYTKPQEDLDAYNKGTDYSLALDLVQFVKSFKLFLQKQKRMEDVKKRYAVAERQQMTMENRIEQLRRLLFGKKKMKFKELLDEGESRFQIVLTFLSMLELIRQKTIVVEQAVNFGEITIIPKETEEPKDDQ
ncbi:MAG: segregation/condensation protein A [Eubacteriales bacterium]|nr:segregation/condensation protein A [Eubacteriales bacterium]